MAPWPLRDLPGSSCGWNCLYSRLLGWQLSVQCRSSDLCWAFGWSWPSIGLCLIDLWVNKAHLRVTGTHFLQAMYGWKLCVKATFIDLEVDVMENRASAMLQEHCPKPKRCSSEPALRTEKLEALGTHLCCRLSEAFCAAYEVLATEVNSTGLAQDRCPDSAL